MGKGEMASVQASAEEVEPHLTPYGERVSIAAHNGPRATVLSGEPEAISELIASFESEGTRARLIPVGYASHCAQIEAIESELKAAIAGIDAKDSEVPFYSTLSGEPLEHLRARCRLLVSQPAGAGPLPPGHRAPLAGRPQRLR